MCSAISSSAVLSTGCPGGAAIVHWQNQGVQPLLPPRQRPAALISPNLRALVFAAGDVPEQEFLARLPAIHGLSDHVIVYISDDDSALRWASRLMGGGRRLGLAPANLSDVEKQALRQMPGLGVVDPPPVNGVPRDRLRGTEPEGIGSIGRHLDA